VPPILLIDEAENHLHFDAQADLVNTFMIQEQAAKVIYTTHSPACLPPDLGTGIRAVLPSADNGQVSEIHNSFWNRSAGYSPLMLAMGAGAAAFSPARIVVLAEGASEMILLPSLIRAANKLDTLGYQIAPGLSEVPKRLYPELDLEAARVAYLVDGDEAGQSLKTRLADGGVPAKLIVDLGAQTLENLLDSEVYRDTVRALMQETASDKAIPELPRFDDEVRPWPTVLKVWANQHHVKLPSKVAVANRIVETGMIRLNRAERTTLVKLHKRLTTVLRLN
jgi:predicted ATP-dependent endonuclease of OLD family